MHVTAGEHRGLSVQPTSYCNDWITADTQAGGLVVLDPLHVQLSAEEAAWFREPDLVGQAGDFWAAYALSGDHFQRVRHPDPGGLVQSGDTVEAVAGGAAARPADPEEPVISQPPVAPRSARPPERPSDPIARDSPAGNMIAAVHAGNVVYNRRADRSGWTSAFHAAGFEHLGRSLTGHLWGRVEQSALDQVVGLGLVMLRQGMHWVLTPMGKDLYWRWTHSQDQTPQLDEPS